MIAAIYARKSTEQTGVSDDAKSVTRQIEQAKAYAAKKGWIVAEKHIYVDHGISGAEFAKRPGLVRLLDVLVAIAPFDAVHIEDGLRRYLKDWSGLAQRHPAQTRQILRKLLPERQRIRVWHDGGGRYRFAGEAVLGAVFKGFVEGKYFGVPNGI